ncbi:MAG TPA: sulfur carrier protein ThiS [Longimicrobiales bacterium]|nr:sulfur carrier protein ThiS [Longimicrobiales bacterium]
MNQDASNIRIRLNGQDRDIPGGRSVQDLLVSLDLRPELVVVERNREILDRARYPEVVVEEGDSLELVHFVGGG